MAMVVTYDDTVKPGDRAGFSRGTVLTDRQRREGETNPLPALVKGPWAIVGHEDKVIILHRSTGLGIGYRGLPMRAREIVSILVRHGIDFDPENQHDGWMIDRAFVRHLCGG